MSPALSVLSNSNFEFAPRIVNGYEVNPPFKYPFMMNIIRDGSFYCGGTLYNADTMITAAHCSFEAPINYTVQSHRHDRTKTAAEEDGKVYNVKKIIAHPEHDKFTKDNDIAIWKLDTDVDNSETYVDLDSGSLGNQSGLINTVIGWGDLNYNRTHATTLQEIKIPIVDSEKCKNSYGSKKTINAKTMLCAGVDDGFKNPCFGDSGGPLGVVDNNKFTLVGVVSFGRYCGAPDYPEVFARVSNYIDWIKSYAN